MKNVAIAYCGVCYAYQHANCYAIEHQELMKGYLHSFIEGRYPETVPISLSDHCCSDENGSPKPHGKRAADVEVACVVGGRSPSVCNINLSSRSAIKHKHKHKQHHHHTIFTPHPVDLPQVTFSYTHTHTLSLSLSLSRHSLLSPTSPQSCTICAEHFHTLGASSLPPTTANIRLRAPYPPHSFDSLPCARITPNHRLAQTITTYPPCVSERPLA